MSFYYHLLGGQPAATPAPVAELINWGSLNQVSYINGILTKTGSSNWSGGAIGQVLAADRQGFIEYTFTSVPSSTAWLLGFDASAVSHQGLNMQYSFLYGNNYVNTNNIRESSNMQLSDIPVAVNDVFKLSREKTGSTWYIRYFKNTTMLREVNLGTGSQPALYPQAQIYTTNNTINNAKITLL